MQHFNQLATKRGTIGGLESATLQIPIRGETRRPKEKPETISNQEAEEETPQLEVPPAGNVGKSTNMEVLKSAKAFPTLSSTRLNT